MFGVSVIIPNRNDELEYRPCMMVVFCAPPGICLFAGLIRVRTNRASVLDF